MYRAVRVEAGQVLLSFLSRAWPASPLAGTPQGYPLPVPVIDLRRALREDELDAFAGELEDYRELLVPVLHLLREIRAGAPGPWKEFAMCEGRTSLMFPNKGESSEPGLALCSMCGVRGECQEWADGLGNELHGIAGGETQNGRRRRRRQSTEAA